MVMETLFPLCLVLPAPWGWALLGWGVLFHVLCAVIMGFNGFLWAFLAAYPAIRYVAAALRAHPLLGLKELENVSADLDEVAIAEARPVRAGAVDTRPIARAEVFQHVGVLVPDNPAVAPRDGIVL
jgi:hypothetical protein